MSEFQPDGSIQTVQFSLHGHHFKVLALKAAEHGFRSASGYARWLVEQACGITDGFNALGDGSFALLSKPERLILGVLADHSATIPQVAVEVQKQYSYLLPVSKGMRIKGWIDAVEEKYTGGRPAVIYGLTEAGRTRLTQELERVEAHNRKMEELRQNQAIASAKANPDRLNKRTIGVNDPKANPESAFAHATITAIYDWADKAARTLTDAELMARYEYYLIDRRAEVEGGQTSTWEAETTAISSRGWDESGFAMPDPKP